MDSVKASLDPAEYERRRAYCELVKTMNRVEHIEIARMLRVKGVEVSENRQGIFFDVSTLPQEVFEALLQFHEFVVKNATDETT